MTRNEAEPPTVLIAVSQDASAARLVLRPCVCGGEILANANDPIYGVQLHNYSARHLIWRWYERSGEVH